MINRNHSRLAETSRIATTGGRGGAMTFPVPSQASLIRGKRAWRIYQPSQARGSFPRTTVYQPGITPPPPLLLITPCTVYLAISTEVVAPRAFFTSP